MSGITENERRLVVLVLVHRWQFGSASPELVVRRSGLGRVEGYRALAGLERSGLIERDPREGVLVSFSARMYAGL